MRVKRLTDDNLVARGLAWFARAIARHPAWFVYPQLLLFVLCVIYTVKYLEFDTRRDHLVGTHLRHQQNFLKYKKEFPTQDDLVVVAESDDQEKNRQFVERLGAKLEAETNLFHDVLYRNDPKMLGRKALLMFPETNLFDLEKTLREYRPFIEKFTKTTNLVSLFSLVNAGFRTARQEENEENKAMVRALPALERIITQARESLLRSGIPPSPGITALFDAGDEAQREMYITFGGGSMYLVTSQAPTEEKNDDAVARLRELVAQTRFEVPGINVGITGEPVLDMDEMAQSQKDTALASVVSLVICALIFIYGYQETGRPVKATFCLIVGLAYTLAFATVTVHHLNILTITFVPILIGLAIDYGVHLISRYEEELRLGKSEPDALARAMVYTGQGILTGALTTAGAFLAMCITSFKGIQEMGIICGGGLIICLIPMMTMLPAMLLKGKQNVLDHELGEEALRRARIESVWLQRPVLVSVLSAALCAAAATQVHKVVFDYNLLHMQSESLPSVEYGEALVNATNETGRSILFAAVVATNLEEAAALERQITNLPSVAGVDSISRFFSEDQTGKLAIVGRVKQELAGLTFSEPDPRPVDTPELSATLYSLVGYLGNAIEETKKDEPDLSAQMASLRKSINDLRKAMNSGPGTQESKAAKLARFQQALLTDVRDTFDALRTQDDSAPLSEGDLPEAIRDRFIGRTGKYLLMVYPKKDVWQRENQEEFVVRDLEKVDPNVTGTPVQFYYYTDLLKKSYEEAARYSLVAIVLLVLFHFRSPLAVALSLVPVGIGFLWLGGIMGLLDIPLNPANIMTLPLVIGIGVTNGIHVLNRFAEEQSPDLFSRSTGKAVLVSGLTTIAGFGSLILAKHRGIQSLGWVMSVGLATCMIAGLTFLPALLNLVVKPMETKQPSAGRTGPTPGREEPR